MIGVYSGPVQGFPIDKVLEKNLTVKAGNCNHHRYLPEMIELVRSRTIQPGAIPHAEGAAAIGNGRLPLLCNARTGMDQGEAGTCIAEEKGSVTWRLQHTLKRSASGPCNFDP